MQATPSSVGSNPSASPVLVIQRSEHIWQAKFLAWAGFDVEGNSREDALYKLGLRVQAQLADGEITYLNLPLTHPHNPWLTIAGKYSDDPNWDDYLAAIEADRQESNAAEGIDLEGEIAA